MSRFMRVCAAVVIVVAPALATPFDVPIDQSQSVLYFELCISGECDTDSSAVAGTVTIDLDSIETPTQIWLYDFDMNLVDNLHWYLSWGWLGSFTADVTGAAVHYAYPGSPMGPVPITAGSFAFVDVPTNSEGVITYHAVGIVCTLLQGAGWPCDGTMNMADQGTQNADEFSGTVTSQNRVVALSNQLDITTPLDPNNPSLGTLHVWGSVYGSVYVPPPILPGDLNCDGVVDFGDINPFVAYVVDCTSWQAAHPDCPVENGDIDGDGQHACNGAPFDDINAFVALLSGG